MEGFDATTRPTHIFLRRRAMTQEIPKGVDGKDDLLGGTLGSLFRAAREARGIPLEQAAHETRIRLSRLREIESNDLSQLSPAYARMFVRNYAHYLGLSERQIEQALPESGEFGIEGYQYIQNAPGAGPRIRKVTPPKRLLRRAIVVLAVVAAVPFASWQGWTIWRKLEAIRNSNLAQEDRLSLEIETPVAASIRPLSTSQEIAVFRAVGEQPLEDVNTLGSEETAADSGDALFFDEPEQQRLEAHMEAEQRKPSSETP